MEFRFDLTDTQLNILEIYPEWQELMGIVDFRNVPEADPVSCEGKTIFYNNRRMRRFPKDVQAFLLARQLMHVQLAHQQRRGTRVRSIWESACEKVADELLIADGFAPPESLIRRKEAAGISAEEMYDILFGEKEDTEPELVADENAEDAGDTDLIIPHRENDKDPDAGSLAGAQDREIEDPGLAKAVAGLADLLEPSMQLDYDWFPADRIRDGMLIEQFRPYPVPHAEILLDTSASIDEDLLRAFVRGVRELLREDAIVKVGCFDTEFYGFQEVKSENDIKTLEIKGSGGTNFETAVRAFTGDAETKIIFTDGYAEMPETRCDAIWLVYSDMPVNPPGGRVIYVKKPEEIDSYEVHFLIT